jgi:hypothetical protein
MNTGRTCAAAAIAFGFAALVQMAAYAQGQSTSAAARATSQERTSPEQQVTVTGCIQREGDYRRAHDAGRGGVAGTGIGAGNEFVLVNASGGAAGAAAYELTGANESKAGQFVGRRVQISGKLKAAEVAPSGKPTGGATAGKPPEGVDVGGKDLKLRELEITTIRETSGTCPGA